jgi:hypothetical protein
MSALDKDGQTLDGNGGTVKFEKTDDDYLAAKLGERATTILWPNRGNAQ